MLDATTSTDITHSRRRYLHPMYIHIQVPTDLLPPSKKARQDRCRGCNRFLIPASEWLQTQASPAKRCEALSRGHTPYYVAHDAITSRSQRWRTGKFLANTWGSIWSRTVRGTNGVVKVVAERLHERCTLLYLMDHRSCLVHMAIRII
jgi:hypothetical protein